MATIVKRPEGTYRTQIRRKGHKALSATFTKRQDAVDWAQKTEAALIGAALFPREGEAHAVRSDSQVHEGELTQVQTRDGREETAGARLVGDATWEGLSLRHRHVLHRGGAGKG
jgi:hypothetical protein